MIKTLFDPGRLSGRLFYCLVSVAIAVGMAHATGPSLTTINDVVYRADGQPAAGTLVISWTAFTTADNKPVAAGELSLTLGAQGALNIALAPNQGATPAGSYYKVVYKLSDGTTATEYWVVPAASPATVGNIRANVVPTQVAAQLVSRQYVDTALSGSDTLVVHKSGSESITGVKAFAVSPTAPNPVASLGIANKTYVDSTVNAAVGAVTTGFVSKSGDNMTGPLTLPADPVSPNQAADRHYVDLQTSLATAAVAQLSFSTLPGRPDTFGFLVNAVTNCGLAGNGVTDDGPALQTCINNNIGKHIVLPKTQALGACDYNMGSTTIFPAGNGQILEGSGAGFANKDNTALCWSTHATGITVSQMAPYNCTNCTIKNLNISGADYWAGTNGTQNIPPCNPPASVVYNAGVVCVNGGDGIQVQANFTSLENLYVSGWGHIGVNLDAIVGDAAAQCPAVGCSAFSDTFHIINVTSNNNRGDGFYCKGGDCNAGSMLQTHTFVNQMYGFDEEGFLGNAYYSPEAHTNHITTAGGGTGMGTTFVISAISRAANVVTLTAAGHNFTTGNVIVVAGVTDGTFNGTFSLSATTSTTATYSQTAGNASSSGGTARLTSNTEYFTFTGMTGGGYYTAATGAAQNTFIAPYAECDNGGKSQMGQGTIVIGGDWECPGVTWQYTPLVLAAGVSNKITGASVFDNQNNNALLFSYAAGSTVDEPIQTRYTGGHSNAIYFEWNMTPTEGSTDNTMSLWGAGGAGAGHSFLTFAGIGHGGITQIENDGGGIRFNDSTNSAGQVNFYSGGGSPTQVAQIDSTGKGQFNGGVAIPGGGMNLTKTAAPPNPASGSILLYADSASGNATCLTSTGASCLAVGATSPTGTGFPHVTNGSQDPAARAVDISTSDITGVIAKSHQTATTMYTDQANAITSGKLSTAASAAGSAGFNIPPGATPSGPVAGDYWMVGTNLFYRDNGVTPATQTIEIQSNKNSASGYAGLDATSKVLPANLPTVSAMSGSVAAAQMPALIGDVTSAAGTVATILAASGVTAGACVKPTVDAKGRATSCATTVSLTSDASGALQAAQFPALTGDVTSLAGSLTTSLAASGVTAGTYNQVTVDVKGRVTAGINPGVSNTTAVTVSGAVSTDQNLMSITMPASSLNSVGKLWESYAAGIYTTGTSGSGTMTFKAKLCTVAGCGSGTVVTLATFGPTVAQSASATNMPWNIYFSITTATSGASGTLIPAGTLNVILGTVPTASGALHVTQTIAASSAIDLTSQLFLQFTVADSGASANNSFKQVVGYSVPLN